MKRSGVRSWGLGVLFFLLAFFTQNSKLQTPNCLAQSLSSLELIRNAKDYDGKTVVYSGEVIGEVMKRGNFAWANISDGENAIGVWLPVELARQVAYTGSYKAYGDLLQVTGIFNSTCREHGGDLDIHAQGISKISSGRDVLNNVNPEKAKQALALLGILAAVWILTLLKRK